MRNESLCKKGRRLRRITTLLFRLRGLGKKQKGKERYVTTSHGAIRVLEYGFEDAKVTPLYVDMHGGGFVLMDASSDEEINLYLHEKTGVKIISIDYPKAPDAPFPAALEAVYEVVLFYKNSATELGIDASHIGIGGHSAGANLATVTCMRAKEKDNLHLCFQILDYPPLDLYTDPFVKPMPKGAISPKMALTFNTCYASPEQAQNPFVSPVFASVEMLKGLPPALIIVAGLDSLHDEGIRYAEMLKEADAKVELHDFERAAHGFTLTSGEDTQKALELMAGYIRKNFSSMEK